MIVLLNVKRRAFSQQKMVCANAPLFSSATNISFVSLLFRLIIQISLSSLFTLVAWCISYNLS